MTAATDLITARNADITTIRAMLEQQRLRRLDLVVSPGMIYASGGRIVVRQHENTQLPTADGVVSAAGFYLPTDVGDEGIGDMLRIDGGFIKRLRAEDPARTDIIDACVNARLHGTVETVPDPDMPLEYEPYAGNLLLRLLRGDDETDGVLRAMLSPKFRVDMDNLDVLLAVLEGFRAAGITPVPDVCQLSSRRMDIRFVVPQVACLARQLLDGYRSPLRDEGNPNGVARAGELGEDPGDGALPGRAHGMRMRVDQRWNGWTVPGALAAAAREGQGYAPGTEPIVCAGLRVTCSDTGGGARNIFPEIRIRVCKNGLTLDLVADHKTHLGGEKQPGVIQVSAEADAAELALITQQVKDAVKTYTDQDWFEAQVRDIEALASAKVGSPEEVIKNVTKAAKFTKAEADGIWGMFLMSGGTTQQATGGQVANAITAYSQTIASGDRAAELDRAAIPVMRQLAKLAQ